MNKTFKSLVLTIAVLLANTQISCNNDDDNCNNAVCTLVLVRYSVSITDQNQNPVTLDSYEVINLENGENITLSLTLAEEEALQPGEYPLIEDDVIGVNQEQQIRFRGFINDQEVVSSDYTVSTDCCHVSLVAGDLDLTI